MSHDHLKSSVTADMPRLRSMLEDLIRIPSVSAPGFDKAKVREAADYLVGTLESSDYQNVQLLEAEGGNPAVFGEIPAPPGAPTVLLYAHYDVQPPGPEEDWKTGPFDPFEDAGRIYGRGSSDDKAGIVMHLGAVAAHGGDLPVGIQLFFEGEEEAGSESLEEILTRHSDLFSPDVIVIGDGGNWQVGVPSLLVSLRGLAAVSFELRTLAEPLHSGQFGGVFPDALSAMSRLLATLQDEEGNVAVDGLVSEEREGLDIPSDMARQMFGVVEGVEEIGTGTIPSRIWTRPSISVLALDAPRVADAINQLVPVARAKVSLRTAPGENAREALAKLIAHLESHVPWGAQLTILHSESGEASVLDTDNDAVETWNRAFGEAFGAETVYMGAGGSIPFIATFRDLFPDAPILVTGCGDPTSSIHAPNESQDISDLEKHTFAEAIALSLLGSVF